MGKAKGPGPRSLEALKWLARVDVAGLEPWGLALGFGSRATYSHAQRLQAAGLVARIYDREGSVVAITPAGRRLACADHGQVPLGATRGLGLRHARAVDKTGTLTVGQPRLAQVIGLDGLSEDQALALAASAERRSEHPLAQAVVTAARERGLDLAEPDAFQALPGRGVVARVNGRELWAGGPRLALERLGKLPADAGRLEQQGQTATVLGEDRRALAVFALADQPRPEAAAAVAALTGAGVERVVMLTGDNERVAASVAAQVGATAYRAGLLPEDKLRAVDELGHDGGPVAMVGDGINDAPALAAASVGVAMGVAGSDAALQSADVALMSDDLTRLPDAVTSARRAVSVMRQNVIASLAVKAVFVVLAPLGLVTLVLAVAADMGMSLLVTLNGLRLLRGRALPRRRLTADY